MCRIEINFFQKQVLRIIGEESQRIRELNNFSRKDVCKQTGCNYSSVRAFELGLNNNGLLMLWYLKHGLNLTYCYNILTKEVII